MLEGQDILALKRVACIVHVDSNVKDVDCEHQCWNNWDSSVQNWVCNLSLCLNPHQESSPNWSPCCDKLSPLSLENNMVICRWMPLTPQHLWHKCTCMQLFFYVFLMFCRNIAVPTPVIKSHKQAEEMGKKGGKRLLDCVWVSFEPVGIHYLMVQRTEIRKNVRALTC